MRASAGQTLVWELPFAALLLTIAVAPLQVPDFGVSEARRVARRRGRCPVALARFIGSIEGATRLDVS